MGLPNGQVKWPFLCDVIYEWNQNTEGFLENFNWRMIQNNYVSAYQNIFSILELLLELFDAIILSERRKTQIYFLKKFCRSQYWTSPVFKFTLENFFSDRKCVFWRHPGVNHTGRNVWSTNGSDQTSVNNSTRYCIWK